MAEFANIDISLEAELKKNIYPFKTKTYPWKEYVDANTPKPGGIRGMHFIEFAFINVNEIHRKDKIKNNFGRLGETINAKDLEPIVGVFNSGEYDFAGHEPPVITPEGELVAGEHRFVGKKRTPLIDISKAKYGGEWLFVAICEFDDLEALRDYSFAENNKKISFVKRYSSYDSSIANITEYLKTLEPKYRNKSKIIAKLKETSWEGCEIKGVYVNFTNADKNKFAEECMKSIGLVIETKKRYDRPDVIDEFIDEGHTTIQPETGNDIHPEDDPNIYIGAFKNFNPNTGFDPGYIRATEKLSPFILKGEDVKIIAFVDGAKNKVDLDILRNKIADNYYKNIIESAYSIVSCDMKISVESLKKKSKRNLGKVTFYFCGVFKSDPLFTIIEAAK